MSLTLSQITYEYHLRRRLAGFQTASGCERTLAPFYAQRKWWSYSWSQCYSLTDEWPLTKVKGSKVIVTRLSNVSAARKRQRIAISTSHLMKIFTVRGKTRNTLSRSLGWLRGPAVEHWSSAGVLSLSCARPTGQPTRPTQPFILSG